MTEKHREQLADMLKGLAACIDHCEWDGTPAAQRVDVPEAIGIRIKGRIMLVLSLDDPHDMLQGLGLLGLRTVEGATTSTKYELVELIGMRMMDLAAAMAATETA